MDTTVTLRPALRSDLARLDALLARAFPRLLAADYPPSVMVTAVPRLARARPELLRGGRYWVAEGPGGAIVAGGGWSPGPPGRAEVRQVATDPAQLRRGLGRAVLERVMADAAAAGAVRLDCLATRTAEPFYASLGFEAFGEIVVPLAPGIGFPAVRMRRPLGG